MPCEVVMIGGKCDIWWFKML